MAGELTETEGSPQGMSFSAGVKEELARHTGQARHCQMAELAAILTVCGRLEEDSEGGRILRIHTENDAVLRKCFTLLKKTYNIESEIFSPWLSFASGGGSEYDVTLEDSAVVSAMLEALRLREAAYPTGSLVPEDAAVAAEGCCKRAYLRGAFMASGSVSDPQRGYHFEIVYPDRERAALLQEILEGLSVAARIVPRKKSFVVYVKEGEQIVELLALMEANVALMDMENVRILREMRGAVNRKVNCETANIHKTVSASVRQLEDIRLIREKLGFERLDDTLAEMAMLRLRYPEATLSELGQQADPPVGKSGVNHRLRKLGSIAADLRQNEEEKI